MANNILQLITSFFSSYANNATQIGIVDRGTFIGWIICPICSATHFTVIDVGCHLREVLKEIMCTLLLGLH
jgi:hypothetical protein